LARAQFLEEVAIVQPEVGQERTAIKVNRAVEQFQEGVAGQQVAVLVDPGLGPVVIERLGIHFQWVRRINPYRPILG
jgi:hypothetical protein